MSAHTPWEVLRIESPAGTSARIFADALPATDIAHIPMQWYGDGSNARLIAAAPDLLAIVETLFNRWSNSEPGSPHRTIDDNDAALLRAAIVSAKEIA
jgi:hypothetical protein